jgi:hypothetical protein
VYDTDRRDLEIIRPNYFPTNFKRVTNGSIHLSRVIVERQGSKRGKRLNNSCYAAISVSILLRAVE